MNPNLKIIKSLLIFILISCGNAFAQVKPMVGQCTVYSISPSYMSAGSGAGMVGTVSVTSQNNCTNYTLSKNGSWLSYSQNGLSVSISVQANTGAARDGYVYIGGSFTVTVHQACGNVAVAPTRLSVDRNNFCSNAGGNITLNAIGGSGSATRWFSGSCNGTQVGYTDASSISIAAPTSTTTYYARWETSCNNSICKSITVTVNQLPVLSISGTTSVCPGSTYTYTTNAGLSGYAWSIPSGASGSSSTNSIDVTFGSTSGTISVTATDGNGCTSNPATLGITVNYLYQYSVIGGGTTCPGVGIPVSLQGSTNGIVYKCYLNGSWQSGDMITGNGGSNVSWNKSYPGTYTIKGVSGGCEIPMSGSMSISNYSNSENPTSVTASPNPICKNTSTTLTVNGGNLGTNANWNWYTAGCGTGTPFSVGTSRTISVSPTTTTTYWVKPVGDCGINSCVSVQVNVTDNPVITSHPQNVTICDGAATSFGVSAIGSNTYQWQYQISGIWSDISGATGTTYSIPSTIGMDGRGFRCKVTNTCFTSTSNPAYIQFSNLTLFEVYGNATICPGSSSEIKLTGSISGTTYNLYLNGSSAHQAVTSNGGEITFGNKSVAGIYTVKGVTSIGCEVLMYGSATIIVRTESMPPSSINASPSAICPGGSPGGGSTLTMVGGSLEPGYGVWHWYSGGTPCGATPEGSNTTTITVSPTVTTTYSVRAEGGCVITSCAYTTINVKPLPSITAQPVSSNVSLGSDATFSVTATGPNLQYQWQVSPNGVDPWTDLTGLPAQNYQTANLTIKGSTTFEDNWYECKITSDCSTIYSNAVKIVLQFPGSGYLTGQDIPDPETRQLSTSNLVGATNGSFNVNPMGGSSYTIPIETPPGVNGLAPSLAMSYSSNSGSGIPGFGWQISGISSISLGARLPYLDSPGTDNFDRYYLDGQRLQSNSSSISYGNSATRYQTENEIFTRVTPEGYDATYGPTWFKAETKSGYIFDYGYIPSSRQKLSVNSKVLNWYVSCIKDLFGNRMDFTYIQDHYSVYPSEITYGPNTITFYYKQRNDKNPALVNGVKIEQWLLLDKIIIKYNSSIVKTYEFKQSYPSSNYNSSSILNEVIEYGLGSNRLNSTAFSYQIPENVSFTQTAYNTTHQYVTYKSKLFTGDFNGDGKADFLCLPDSTKGATWSGMRVYFGDGADNFTSSFTSNIRIDQRKLRDLRIMDLNGDGIDDILYEYGKTATSDSSYFNFIICNGLSFSQPICFARQTDDPHTGMTGKFRRNGNRQEDDNEHVYRNSLGKNNLSSQYPSKTKCLIDADFNGDGKNDVFINDPNSHCQIFYYNSTSGQMTRYINTTFFAPTFSSDVLSGDFNGDGLVDLWSFESTGLEIYSFSAGTYGEIGRIYNSTWPTNHHYFTLGDFNGDGRVDLFLYGYKDGSTEYDWPNWEIQLSTGSGFEEHDVPQKKANLKNDYIRTGDFNGDGANDVMVTSSDQSWTGTYFYISKNNGTDLYTESLPSYPSASHNFYLADYDGDGRTDFICTDGLSPWWDGYQVYRSPGNTSILMNKVANGLGALAKFTYTKLSQASNTVYTRGTGATFPVMEFQGPWSVVSSVRADNGKGSKNTQNYYYEGAKVHLKGKGFLGFAKTIVTDVTSGIESHSIFGYNSTYYYPTSLKSFSRLVGTTDTIERVSNSWSHVVLDATNQRIFPYIQSSTQVNKLTGLSVSSGAQYDNYGNPTSITKVYSNGLTQSTSNTYDNTISSSQWLLGRPTTTTLQFTNDTTITRTGTRVFDSNWYHVTSETWFAGTNNEITKSYVYNTNGTLQSQTATAGSVSRSNSFTYETDNIRIHSATDQLSHVTTNSYDTNGRLYTQQDFLGNVSTYGYDALGRQNSILSPDGSQITTAYAWQDTTADPVPARYSVDITGNNGSQKQSWFDKLGREIRSDVKGFAGTMIYTATVYNTKGQVESISEPYYSGGSPLLNTLEYDDYGRKTSITRPSGRNTSLDYNNNIVTETTGGKSYYKTYSSDGTISSATDNGGTITYTYYPDGKSRTITAPGGNMTNMYYDLAGNQKKLVDPSAGTIKYFYNGFGELISQKSPGPKTTTISYIDDGRISQKVTSEGTTKYRYNTNKQLRNSSSPDNVAGNISKTYRYDALGRLKSITDTIPGTDTLRTAFSYDNIGRSSIITHPSGIVESYTYSNGYLSSVSAGGTARWTINSMNARRQITTGQFANSLNATYDYDDYGFPTYTSIGTIKNDSCKFDPVTGNMKRRRNNKYTGLIEVFHYDNLDRLIGVQKNDTTTLTYDSSTGSILSKSDAGTFNYDLKPYAISSIDPSIGFTPADTADAQSINYTSVGSISSITERSYEADFLYNSDNERVQMLVKQNGTSILTRWYSDAGYVKEIDGSTSREYTFIGGDAYSAPVVAITQGGTTSYYDLLRDNLGSITHVVNSSTNAVVAEYSYDAWGRMRNPATWVNYTSGSEPALFIAGRGYTGHEHMPWFNMINMNGRLYDPLIAMFLSPDNYIQDPTSTQNYNRYGYCLNNPLKYSDPSGMVAKARDPEGDAAFDAYFYWLCDGSMSFGNMAGGGGGGAYSGFYSSGGSDVYDEVNSLINSEYGGLWSSISGTYFYTNQDEAFKMSCLFTDANNLWSSTIGGSFNSAIIAYDGGRLANEIIANNPKFLTSSFDGGVTQTISIQDLAPKQNFDGFWGHFKYFLTGGNVGNYHYGYDGKVNGIAPITGIAPTPGFGKGFKIIQYGGHTLERGTLNALKLTKEEGKIGIEALKKANGLPPDFHGNIGSDGSFWSKSGEFIDNILDYLKQK